MQLYWLQCWLREDIIIIFHCSVHVQRQPFYPSGPQPSLPTILQSCRLRMPSVQQFDPENILMRIMETVTANHTRQWTARTARREWQSNGDAYHGVFLHWWWQGLSRKKCVTWTIRGRKKKANKLWAFCINTKSWTLLACWDLSMLTIALKWDFEI